MTIKQIFAQNNLLIQQTSYTCGPCSILNVLRAKGDDRFSEHELAALCDCQPNVGTSNENLVKVIKHVGLELIEAKSNASIGDVERHLGNGVSVIVNYVDAFSGDGHYSVITEDDDRAFYLRDCWFGLLRLSKKDFEKFWHNSDSTVLRWYAAVR